MNPTLEQQIEEARALLDERGGGVLALSPDGTLVVMPFVEGKITARQARAAQDLLGLEPLFLNSITKDSEEGQELLFRAREALGLDTETGGPVDDMPQWLTEDKWFTWQTLCDVAEEHCDRCNTCEADFPMGSVKEDKCPECGEEGVMTAGFYLFIWGGDTWVSYP